MKVSILGLNKALVLEALYDGALYQAAKFDAQPAIREQAMSGKVASPFVKRMLANQFIKEKNQDSHYSDYQFGTIDLGTGPRELAIDLSGFEIDVSEYNELHGERAAEKIIAKLRGELPKNPERNKVQSEEKNLFYTTIKENADWLQPIFPEMMQSTTKSGKKTKDFAANLDKIISENEVQKEYEKKPEQVIYLTWIKMLDPKIDQQTKENLCSELAQRYIDDQGDHVHKVSIGGTLSYMPSIITAPILLYSPIKVLSAYYEYQKEYGEFSRELCDKNFETTLKFLISNKVFSKQAKTFFLKKITEMLKQRMQQSYFKQGDTDYLIHEAMANWEKNSLTTPVSAHFDQELQAERDKFKEKLHKTVENPGTSLRLSTEFGSFAFEKLLVEHKYNAEKLTPIVARFNDDKDIQKLDAIYTAHGLNKLEMFTRHLVQLANSTNEPDHYEFSSLFFSRCLHYLKGQEKSIAPRIAALISAEYYAKEAYAFDTIRKEMFTFWIEHKPEQITKIVKAVLAMPKDSHETPIDKFFSDLSYAKMPDSFYDKLVVLLSDKLTSEQFIRVYTAAPEIIQHKFLAAVLIDENKALTSLKKLNAAYKAGDFSAVFPRKISSQLKMFYPKLHKQAETEKLFAGEEAKDDLETDLRLLGKILANESLTHDERRSEIHRLENLHAALSDKKMDTCPVVIKMFNSIPQTYWSDLFSYFDTQIIHWSFPEDERHLKLFYPDKENRPPPRKNTWINFKAEWEDVLYGTLVAILVDLQKGLRSDVAHWALSHLDEAFTKSSAHFPGLADTVLKKFFLKNFPNSIKIFMEFHNKFQDKYHAPQYFSRKGIYDQVASWLPEDMAERTVMLALLLQIDGGFEPALRSPFVRSKDEVEKTAFALTIIKSEHIVNLFERLPSGITSILFKSLYQFNGEKFLRLLQAAFSDIGKAGLSPPYYMRLALMLLSNSKNANIDIFKIIDADLNKDILLKAISHIETLDYSDELIFNIVQHYQPEQLQKFIFERIQQYIKKDTVYSLCYCIRAAQKVTGNQFVLPQFEKNSLKDYLTQKMSEALICSHSEMIVMSDFIPNLDKLLLELIAKEVMIQNDLPSRHKECLDNLVRVYGFSHINALCLDFKLIDCSTYLIEKFGKFPEILQQTEEAVELYDRILDDFRDKVDQPNLWHFYDNLRSAITQAAKESKTMTLEVNVVEVCAKAGIASEVAALMPPLKIKSTRAEIDELNESSKAAPKITAQEVKPQSPASLMTASWEKSGLITSPPSSAELPPIVEPQKKSEDCQPKPNLTK